MGTILTEMAGKGIRADGITQAKALRQDDAAYEPGWGVVLCSRCNGWAGGAAGTRPQDRHLQIMEDVGYWVEASVLHLGGPGGAALSPNVADI